MRISPAKLLFVALLLAAIFVRFYNLSGTLMFLGDQGRDALVVSKMFLERDLVFIGPVTSVGNLYLGPFYYYFMLPWLFLSYPSPLGPAVAVAVVSIAAIILLYRELKAVFGEKVALLSSIFFAFSSSVVSQSRFSWNPNIEPIFSILLFFALLKFWQDNSPRQLVWIALTTAILLQLHYITLLVLPVVGIVWILAVRRAWRKRTARKPFFLWSGVAIGIVLMSMLPLVLFDIKHEGLNIQGAAELFQSDSFNESAPWWVRAQRILSETHGRSLHIFFETQIGENRVLNTWLLRGVLVVVAWLLYRLRGRQRAALQLLALFLGTAIIGLSFYTSSVFDHYILFVIPFACVVFGIALGKLWESKRVFAKLVVLATVLAYLICNWSRYSFATAGLNISLIAETASEIHKLVEPGEKYEIMLLSATRDIYGTNYRYFLSSNPEKKPLEPELHHTAETLIIINEERVAPDPLSLPIYELVVFPNKTPSQIIELPNGVELFVLRTDSSSV
ncbi:MAG: glycosyltransferase family 39 protein [bacterium]|nr:glycosyltransferase family 39 protein [bacterium]